MAAFTAVILAATLTIDFSVRRTWENSLRNDVERLLFQNVEAFALRVQNDRQHSLQEMAAEESRITETRTTIIAHDGTVLADSEADPKTMENHAGRPEVAAALQGKTGKATRLSHTVGVEFLYVAAPSGDKVVRLAYPLSSIRSHLGEIRRTLLRASLLALLLALLLAVVAAQTIASKSASRRARSERSEEHTSELQSLTNLVCRLLLEKKKTTTKRAHPT